MTISDGEAGRILDVPALRSTASRSSTPRAHTAARKSGSGVTCRTGGAKFRAVDEGGYGVDGAPGLDRRGRRREASTFALARLRTEVVDVFHLHSCDARIPRERRHPARGAGGRSARGEDPRRGVPRARTQPLDARDRDPGLRIGAVLGEPRRSAPRRRGYPSRVGPRLRAHQSESALLANAAWRFTERPHGDYAEVYWERLQSLRSRLVGADWPNLALRFSAFAPGVSVVIAGTKSLRRTWRQTSPSCGEGPLDPRARA